jgi:sialidase-1
LNILALLAVSLSCAIRIPAASAFLEKQNIFNANEGGYAHYRNPGIVATSKGTLLAYCEANIGASVKTMSAITDNERSLVCLSF